MALNSCQTLCMPDRTCVGRHGQCLCQWKFVTSPVYRSRSISQSENHFRCDPLLRHGYLQSDIYARANGKKPQHEGRKKQKFGQLRIVTCCFAQPHGARRLLNQIFYLARCCCSGCANICNWYLPFCENEPICVCSVVAPKTPILLLAALFNVVPMALRRIAVRAIERGTCVTLFNPKKIEEKKYSVELCVT